MKRLFVKKHRFLLLFTCLALCLFVTVLLSGNSPLLGRSIFATPKPLHFTFPQTNRGRFPFSYPLFGAVPLFKCPPKTNLSDFYFFSDQTPPPSKIRQELKATVESSILYSFSPLVDNHVRRMFNREITEREPWFSPRPFQVSCLPENTKSFLCAVRVWFYLQRFQSFRNRFQDSYLYLLQLDDKLELKENSGHLLGIPAAVNELHYTGPEDPMLVALNGSQYITYLSGQRQDGVEATVRRPYLWSLGHNVVHDIEIEDFRLNHVEKNWSPLVVKGQNADELFFIYQLSPVTRVLKCRFHTDIASHRFAVRCKFISGSPEETKLNTENLLLRGGSPFVHYKSDYYLAVTHTVQVLARGLVYAAQLTLLNIQTKRIVLVSSPIFIHPSKMRSSHKINTILDPFFYARSIYVDEPSGSLILAGGVNDQEAFIVKLNGAFPLLDDAIKEDTENKVDAASCDATSSVFDKMLLAGNLALENWIEQKNLEQIDAQL